MTEAWGPLGLNVRRANDASKVDPLSPPTVRSAGENHNKTPAQVLLRWHLQRGCVAIPKSVNDARIRENFDVFDFQLTDDEMAAINALDTGKRIGLDPREIDAATFPISVNP